MNIKEEMVKRLKNDCNVLINKKMPMALTVANDDRGVGTYRNLTKALAENIKLIEEYDYKLMYSEYTTGENKQKQVAVWEQNSNGDIRNHKVWDVNGYGLKADYVNGKASKQESNLDWLIQFERNIDSVVDNFSVNEKVIIPTSEAFRCVGKTTYLLKKAFENDGIYICRNKIMSDIAMEKARTIFGHRVDSAYFVEELKEDSPLKFTSNRKLYIDEGVDLSRINLEDNKYVIFKYMPLNSK